MINLGAERWQGASADVVTQAALAFAHASRDRPPPALTRVFNRRRDGCPAGAVTIDRSTKWGNPFRVGADGSWLTVVVKYKRWLPTQSHLMAALDELRGRDLVYWCVPKLCHGNVPMPMANRLR